MLELKVLNDGCRKEGVYVYHFTGSRYDLLRFVKLPTNPGDVMRFMSLAGTYTCEDRGGAAVCTVQICGSYERAVVRHRGEDCRGGGFDRAWLVYGNAIAPLEVRREAAAEVERSGAGLYEVVYAEVPGYGRYVFERRRVGRAEASEARAPVGVLYDDLRGELSISGQTYGIRDELKRLGFRWDRECRCWIKRAGAEEARRLVEEIRRLRGVFIEHEIWSAEWFAPSQVEGC
jgi:hypothetical protein